MEPPQIALLIPIIGIVFGIGLAVIAVVTQSRRRVQEFEMRHKERMAAIERGLDLPPEPLEPVNPQRVRSHTDYLRRGMVFLAVGIAVYFSAGELVGRDLAQLGAIPAAVGVAYLLFYVMAKPKDEAKGPQPPAARE